MAQYNFKSSFFMKNYYTRSLNNTLFRPTKKTKWLLKCATLHQAFHQANDIPYIFITFSHHRPPLRKGKRGGILLRRKYPLRIPPFFPSLKGVHVAKGWWKSRVHQKLAFHKFIEVLLTFLKRAQTRKVRKNWGSMVQGPGVSKSKKCFSVVIWYCP